MFKKITIALSLGALSLTGCSLAPAGHDAADGARSSAATPGPSAPAAGAIETGSAAPDEEAAPVEAEVEVEDPGATSAGSDADSIEPVPAAPALPAPAPEPVKAAGPAPAPVAPQAGALPAAPAAAPAAAAGDGAQAAAAFGWGPVVAGDEFSNTGAPDSTKWSMFKGSGHAGKGVRSPAAWSVANGVATVSGDSAGTTGGMSAKFAQQKYGRWETRMKTNSRDPQYHPVLILWPDRGTTSQCAEIDYAEGSNDTENMKFFLHFACGGSEAQTYAKHAVDSTQWHNYAVEWTPAGITGYIDGVQTFSDTNPAHQPTVSMHQTLQLDWFPNGSSTKPSQMHVDWVRVYK